MIIVKFGGSVITNKKRAFTARRKMISNLAGEIRGTKNVLVTHGSGSFGHFTAKKYMAKGFTGKSGVLGSAKVSDAAARLNRIVVDELLEKNIPAVSFQPSSALFTQKGKIKSWNTQPVSFALKKGFVPVVYGDVSVDSSRGSSIVSTEDLILFLSKKLRPRRVILCSDVDGVLVDGIVVSKITMENFSDIKIHLGASAGVDVTGGMLQKVRRALEIARYADVLVINGKKKGTLRRALKGRNVGTRISY